MITLDTLQQLFHLSISPFGATLLLTELRAKFSWALWACLFHMILNSMEHSIKIFICRLMVDVQKKTKHDIIFLKLVLFQVIQTFLKI
jgi:hypothetical protein